MLPSFCRPAASGAACAHGGGMPLQILTTYCPDVGIVQLDAARGQQVERATLQSFGAPMDLGPDGVRRIP